MKERGRCGPFSFFVLHGICALCNGHRSPSPIRTWPQGQKLLRVDFDTSAGDETYTTLKASLEMAKQLTKLLAEALIRPPEEEGAESAGETVDDGHGHDNIADGCGRHDT